MNREANRLPPSSPGSLSGNRANPRFGRHTNMRRSKNGDRELLFGEISNQLGAEDIIDEKLMVLRDIRTIKAEIEQLTNNLQEKVKENELNETLLNSKGLKPKASLQDKKFSKLEKLRLEHEIVNNEFNFFKFEFTPENEESIRSEIKNMQLEIHLKMEDVEEKKRKIQKIKEFIESNETQKAIEMYDQQQQQIHRMQRQIMRLKETNDQLLQQETESISGYEKALKLRTKQQRLDTKLKKILWVKNLKVIEQETMKNNQQKALDAAKIEKKLHDQKMKDKEERKQFSKRMAKEREEIEKQRQEELNRIMEQINLKQKPKKKPKKKKTKKAPKPSFTKKEKIENEEESPIASPLLHKIQQQTEQPIEHIYFGKKPSITPHTQRNSEIKYFVDSPHGSPIQVPPISNPNATNKESQSISKFDNSLLSDYSKSASRSPKRNNLEMSGITLVEGVSKEYEENILVEEEIQNTPISSFQQKDLYFSSQLGELKEVKSNFGNVLFEESQRSDFTVSELPESLLEDNKSIEKSYEIKEIISELPKEEPKALQESESKTNETDEILSPTPRSELPLSAIPKLESNLAVSHSNKKRVIEKKSSKKDKNPNPQKDEVEEYDYYYDYYSD